MTHTVYLLRELDRQMRLIRARLTEVTDEELDEAWQMQERFRHALLLEHSCRCRDLDRQERTAAVDAVGGSTRSDLV